MKNDNPRALTIFIEVLQKSNPDFANQLQVSVQTSTKLYRGYAVKRNSPASPTPCTTNNITTPEVKSTGFPFPSEGKASKDSGEKGLNKAEATTAGRSPLRQPCENDDEGPPDGAGEEAECYDGPTSDNLSLHSIHDQQETEFHKPMSSIGGLEAMPAARLPVMADSHIASTHSHQEERNEKPDIDCISLHSDPEGSECKQLGCDACCGPPERQPRAVDSLLRNLHPNANPCAAKCKAYMQEGNRAGRIIVITMQNMVGPFVSELPEPGVCIKCTPKRQCILSKLMHFCVCFSRDKDIH